MIKPDKKMIEYINEHFMPSGIEKSIIGLDCFEDNAYELYKDWLNGRAEERKDKSPFSFLEKVFDIEDDDCQRFLEKIKELMDKGENFMYRERVDEYEDNGIFLD